MKRVPKDIVSGHAARKRLLAGADLLTRAVGVTLGPGGRTVLLDRPAGLLTTKDGVTVAREVHLKDRVANLGSTILKDACIKTSSDAGDGTTSTAVIAAALLREGQRLVAAGSDPWTIARGLREAGALAEDVVRVFSRHVEDQGTLEQVARLASNGDDNVARLLAEAAMAAGDDGTILIEDAYGVDDELVIREGMQVEHGYAHEALAPDGERVLEGPVVAVVAERLSCFADVQEILEEGSQFQPRPVLILAEAIEAEALATLVLNQKLLPCCAVSVKAYRRDLVLEDLAALAKAELVGHRVGLGLDHRKFKAEWLGSFRKVVVQAKKTLFTAYDDQPNEALTRHVAGLQKCLEASDSDFDKDRYRERIAQLTGGVVILRIGGVTEAAMKERRARVEDALGAVRAALKGGVVPGGGIAYLLMAEVLPKRAVDAEDETCALGRRLLAEALRAPLRRIAENAGADGRAIEAKLAEILMTEGADCSTGWDALTGQIRSFDDEPLIVDPLPVVQQAIRSAVSVVSTLLTVEVALTPSR